MGHFRFSVAKIDPNLVETAEQFETVEVYSRTKTTMSRVININDVSNIYGSFKCIYNS